MITPLRVSRVVDINDPLPPCWIRRGPTEPDATEQVGPALFRVGPNHSFRQALASSIANANEVVLLASFLLSDNLIANAMLDAAKRGVRVYVLTASEARLETVVREDDGFEARMIKEHKQLLDRLAGHVLLRSAEHFHAKLLVTDPATNPDGWISTANFNKALQESVELGVRLAPDDASDLASWFAWAFWKEAERELASKGRLARVTEPPAEPARPASTGVVVTASEETGVRDAVLELVASAEKRLVVASYGLDEDHEAVRAIAERAASGVAVTVMTRPRPAVLPAVLRLAAAGATVLAHDKLHAKAIIADDRGLVMTANLQAHGLDHGFEVGVRLSAGAARALDSTLMDWAGTFPWRFDASLDRGQHVGEVCLAEEGLRTGVRSVAAERVVDVGEVVAASATDLGAADEPKLQPVLEDKVYYQRVRYEWEVVPPRLPNKAKQMFREVTRLDASPDGVEKEVRSMEPYSPPVYSRGGEMLVLVRTEDELDAARQLADELDAVVVVP